MPASRTLIGPGDPAPFVLLNEHATAPVLVVCDHASRAFPRAMGRLGLSEADSWRHVAWDLGAGELARGLADALGAPAVLAGYSRLDLDHRARRRHLRARQHAGVESLVETRPRARQLQVGGPRGGQGNLGRPGVSW